MWATDSASQQMGMTVAEIGPGRAVLTMPVQERFLNGHRICHGGFIFTLADSAFAFACNSYNRVTVAQENQITFLSPGRAGELLTATATETARTGRTGVYDIRVTGADGRTVAVMRGLSREIKGSLFEEEEAV
jgi:acyl-CoA thioesterase